MALMDYARALVEHAQWTRWRKGMVDDAGCVCSVDGIKMGKARLPDTSHPATKGWLLHMLREATGTQDACATWLGGEWRLYGWIGASALGRFATEGEALAAALLAAWGDA